MIWMAWRQHRSELLIAGGILAALVIFLLVEGVQMHDAYQQLGVANCLTNPPIPDSQTCQNIVNSFFNTYGWLEDILPWLNLIPALLAILVGAPLVAREVENGTHRLAWTQSVTRSRWIATQLAFVLGAGVVAALVLTETITWFRSPFDQLQGRLDPAGFDLEGIVPIFYMLFALALAITAGVLLRRTILAMLVTMAGFLAIRVPIDLWVRARYEPALSASVDLSSTTAPFSRTDWIFYRGWVDSQGHSLTDYQVFSTCAQSSATKTGFLQCMHAHGWLEYVLYQPADRFWPFQGIESAIFGALAVTLIGLAIVWVRNRVS